MKSAGFIKSPPNQASQVKIEEVYKNYLNKVNSGLSGSGIKLMTRDEFDKKDQKLP